MLKRILYRDPTADAGGAAPAAEAPAAPQIVTPTSYGGSSAHRDWQDPYSDPKFRAQFEPQPPAQSGNAPAATATGSQGGQPVQPTPAGQPEPSASSTATGEAVQAPAEAPKGALSGEDKAYWETKDPAYKDLPDHPAVGKLARSARELEVSHTKSQQYLGVVNQTIEDFKSVLASGDPAEIAKMVEHFGGEVKFDTRGNEERIKDAREGYTQTLQALQAVAAELPQEAIPVLNRVLAHLQAQAEGKVSEIQNKASLREQVQALAKAAGIAPAIGNPNERYKAPAQANMTALEREMNDPKFWDYYKEIQPAFAPGGMFHAQGLTAGKAFGASIDSARHYMSIAKGLWLQKNMPSVLSQHEQAWLKKQQGNGAVAPPPKGVGAVTAPRSTDNTLDAHAKAMEEHMKRRSGAGV